MSKQALMFLFERDLEQLTKEISAYSEESALWVIDGDIRNSGGNLCLHICGNLQHFVGKMLGNSDYVRQREQEFSDKDVPTTTLVALIETTKKVVLETIDSLSAEDMKKKEPVEFYKKDMDVEQFLIHLFGHMSYHLGQINYHRRLLNN
ncbi:DinB family protein [Fulvivirgaceae bacterium BMA12]|uniref:DinB family protein n=1 Tax=Agaribacillus aureus TaxID=3051825 RepID=A0ABT8LC93_9BACT|nr:DinB family protein [Fulvivirgaceae bacterium BMA12]